MGGYYKVHMDPQQTLAIVQNFKNGGRELWNLFVC